MTKVEFLERLYITEESESDMCVTYNDTYNYTFVHLHQADKNKVQLVFDTPNPTWQDVRSLMHDIRLYGEINNSMKMPVRYPIAKY